MLKNARQDKCLLLVESLGWGNLAFETDSAKSLTSITQQSKTVRGVVTDDYGPVVGASVTIKGTNKGTVSNMDGSYVLEVNPGDIIVVSFVGYLTQELRYTCHASHHDS